MCFFYYKDIIFGDGPIITTKWIMLVNSHFCYNFYCQLIYLTTLLTSSIEFSLYFQNRVRYLNENFREVRKTYETGLRSKIMRVYLFFIKCPRHLNITTHISKSRKNQ